MSKKNSLDELATFYIPQNFTTAGTLFGGMIKVRNAIEAIAAVLIIGYPIYLIPMGFVARIAIISVICLPIGILALVGINNGPLSEFLIDVFKHIRLTRKYKYQEKTIDNKKINKKGGDAYEQEK